MHERWTRREGCTEGEADSLLSRKLDEQGSVLRTLRLWPETGSCLTVRATPAPGIFFTYIFLPQFKKISPQRRIYIKPGVAQSFQSPCQSFINTHQGTRLLLEAGNRRVIEIDGSYCTITRVVDQTNNNSWSLLNILMFCSSLVFCINFDLFEIIHSDITYVEYWDLGTSVTVVPKARTSFTCLFVVCEPSPNQLVVLL